MDDSEVDPMTIQVEISAEAEAQLAAQAAARSMDVPAYAAALLEQVARPHAQAGPGGHYRDRPRRAAFGELNGCHRPSIGSCYRLEST